MKKLIMVLFFMLIVTTCGTTKQTSSWKNIGTNGIMVETIDDTINMVEFYKLCKKDTLLSDFDNWVRYQYRDGKEEMIEQWFYIKETDTNSYYIVTRITDTTFRFTNRKIIQK
jgi:hypothetical protein